MVTKGTWPPGGCSETFCDAPTPPTQALGTQTWSAKLGDQEVLQGVRGSAPSAAWNGEGTEGSADPQGHPSLRWLRSVHFTSFVAFLGLISLRLSLHMKCSHSFPSFPREIRGDVPSIPPGILVIFGSPFFLGQSVTFVNPFQEL